MSRKSKNTPNHIEIVEHGYNKKISKWYRNQKTLNQMSIPLFQEFLCYTGNTNILELGCGSGYPVADAIFKLKEINYTGIDLSADQIALAKQQYPGHDSSFKKDEMLNFCQQTDDETYSGIFSMFAIRHLPRTLHAQLYSEIFRILKPEGFLLFDCTQKPHDGVGTWSNQKGKMYWSGFSKGWTMLTLEEIGFTILKQDMYEEFFDGEKEDTLFLLYQK